MRAEARAAPVVDIAMTILLATLNARYTHASLGLRYLLANMGALQAQTTLHEFVIGARPADIVEKLLAAHPRIIGFGVYIWNVEQTTQVVAQLKRLAPQIKVILGGPEVSHEVAEQTIVQLADHVITGWGEVTFPLLCFHPAQVGLGAVFATNAMRRGWCTSFTRAAK